MSTYYIKQDVTAFSRNTLSYRLNIPKIWNRFFLDPRCSLRKDFSFQPQGFAPLPSSLQSFIINIILFIKLNKNKLYLLKQVKNTSDV